MTSFVAVAGNHCKVFELKITDIHLTYLRPIKTMILIRVSCETRLTLNRYGWLK